MMCYCRTCLQDNQSGIAERNVAYIIKIGAIMGLIAVIMAVGGVLGAWFASKAAMNFGADLLHGFI